MKYYYIPLASFYSAIFALTQPYIVQVSIPKCGTHLGQKLLSLITDRPLENYIFHAYYRIKPNDFNDCLEQLPHKNFWFSHMMHNPQYAQQLRSNNCKIFFIYRDPRDQIISYMFHMKKLPRRYPKAINMSFDEIIMDLIITSYVSKEKIPMSGINNLYQQYIGWMHEPHVFNIKFEDIIGPQGGGSLDKQLALINGIANFLEINLSTQRVATISDSLFGNSATFREGKIGSWKKYFTEEHKRAFKEVAGQLLIDLGYEKDMNW